MLCGCAAPPVSFDVPDTADPDLDGFVGDEDCDSTRADVHAGAKELCDGRDDDCDGAVDEDAADTITLWRDADLDGIGGEAVRACEPVPGTVVPHGDCDDARADVYPGATEVCDGVDDDCDGQIDEGAVDGVVGYDDLDLDGFGAGAPHPGCVGAGFTLSPGDCDDAYATVNPGAPEVCGTRRDDDCDPATTCRRTGRLDPPAVSADAYWEVDAADVPWGAWVGDLDGDGRGEAAFTGVTGEPGLSLWWGDTTPSALSTDFAFDGGEGPWVVDGGDVDGDGQSDVLVAAGPALVVWWGARPAEISAVRLAALAVSDVAVVGDMNGDGASEALVGGDGQVSLLMGRRWAEGGLDAPTVAAWTTASLGAPGVVGAAGGADGGDLDADGLADAAFVYQGDGVVIASITYGDTLMPSGTLAGGDATVRIDGRAGPRTPGDVELLPDADGDGYGDLAFAAGALPSHVWGWSGGARPIGDVDWTTASWAMTGSLDHELRLAGGDFDNDGASDLVVAQSYKQRGAAAVSVFYGGGGMLGVLDVGRDADLRVSGTTSTDLAHVVDLRDVNDDGAADLLGVGEGQVWMLTGLGI